MQVITTMEQLDAKIAECNDALNNRSDDAMRALFGGFRVDFSADAPRDPFSPEYRAFQLALYERVTAKAYSVANERTLFDPGNYVDRPFPYYLGSTATAGHHVMAMGFLLRTLDLAPGARVLEFGPGWGNTTLALAQLGFRVTAVDTEPNFCELIRRRAARHGVAIDVVEGDFFWAETVAEPFDAVLFFESFHHCDDHMRLLRALHRAVKPGGAVYFAAEPVIAGYGVPWGLRTDGEALWAMRNFGWLELGFREAYFDAALARTGWRAEKRCCAEPDWASVWIARAAPRDATACEPPSATLPEPGPRPEPDPPSDPAAERLARELAAVYQSTSWRLTAPVRALRRLLS